MSPDEDGEEGERITGKLIRRTRDHSFHGLAGARWHRSRRLLTPAFHFRILDEYFAGLNKNAGLLCAKMGELVAGGPTEIDVLPLIRRCTLDMICGNIHKSGSLIKFNALLFPGGYRNGDGDRDEHAERLRGLHRGRREVRNKSDVDLYPRVISATFERAKRFANVLHERFMTPLHFLPGFIYNWTAHGKEYRKLLGALHSFTDEVIDVAKLCTPRFNERIPCEQVIRERKRSLDRPEPTGHDNEDADVGLSNFRQQAIRHFSTSSSIGIEKRRPFMDLLLLAAKSDSSITDEYVRSEVDTFMFEVDKVVRKTIRIRFIGVC